MIINNVFNIAQMVYLKTDPEQLPRLITGIMINPGNVLYRINFGSGDYYAYDFELSTSPNQGFSLGLTDFVNN